MSRYEKLIVLTAGTAGLAGISLLFYHSLFGMLPMLILLLPMMRVVREKLQEKRSDELRKQFCDGMNAYASAIRAGYSAENGLIMARDCLCRIYGGQCILAGEFSVIAGQLSVNRPLEAALTELAGRTGIGEIREMAEVFSAAKRSGGSLADILLETVNMLREREKLREEIRAMSASQKLEHRIMCVMPAGILLYLNITGTEFVAALYGNARGVLVMTLILIIYGAAVVWGERILKVEI